VSFFGLQNFEPFFYGFAQRNLAFHAQVGDLKDFLLDGLAVVMLFYNDLGQDVKSFNFCKSAVEIDYEVLIEFHKMKKEAQFN
jgi:hypothetical protein